MFGQHHPYSTAAALDSNLLSILAQRERLLHSLSPRTSGSFLGSDSAADDAAPAVRHSDEYTPDRPTMRRASRLASPRSVSFADADPHETATAHWDPTGGSAGRAPAPVRRGEDHSREEERTGQLLAALDQARRVALLRERELQSVRGELADREDQLERMRCDGDLIASCFHRERRYFVQYAAATLCAMEETSRRELAAREGEWRIYTALAETRQRPQPGSHPVPSAPDAPAPPPAAPAAASTSTSSSFTSGDMPPARGAAHNAAMDSSPTRGCRSFSESLNVSPRSHRALSSRCRPPPSPSPERGPWLPGPQPGGGGGGGGGGESPARQSRALNCRAGLLVGVTEAKRRLEGELEAVRRELTALQESTQATEEALTQRILELEEDVAGGEELVADMQEELDDLIATELTAAECQGRLLIERDAFCGAAEALLPMLAALVGALSIHTLSYIDEGKSSELRGSNVYESGEEEEWRYQDNGWHDEEFTGLETPTRDGSATYADDTAPPASPGSDRTSASSSTLLSGSPPPAMLGKRLLKEQLMQSSPPRPTKPGALANSPAHRLQPLTESPARLARRPDATLPPRSLPPLGPSPAATAFRDTGHEVEVLTPLDAAFPGCSQVFCFDTHRLSQPLETSLARACSSPASTTTQGVSPEPRAPQQEDEDDSPVSSAECGDQDTATTPTAASTSRTAGLKHVRFAGFCFPSPGAISMGSGSLITLPKVGEVDPAGAAHMALASCDSGSDYPSSAGQSWRAGKVPGEELFQPQALSYPSLSSALWYLAETDDEDDAEQQRPRIAATTDAGCQAGTVKSRRRERVSNPYDTEDGGDGDE